MEAWPLAEVEVGRDLLVVGLILDWGRDNGRRRSAVVDRRWVGWSLGRWGRFGVKIWIWVDWDLSG